MLGYPYFVGVTALISFVGVTALISWSGAAESRQIAEAVRDWLPMMFESLALASSADRAARQRKGRPARVALLRFASPLSTVGSYFGSSTTSS